MAALLVVGIGIGIFLLWHILNVQAARAQIEATHLANTLAKDRLASFTAQFGTEEQAKKEGRLIEYVKKVAVTFGMDKEKVCNHLFLHSQLRKDLISESFARGVPCEFFDDSDHRDFDCLHNGHPGPEPRAERSCMEQCREFRDAEWLPSDSETCPFCGTPTEIFSPDDEIAGYESDRTKWRRNMDKWERYRKLFPERAAKEEAESTAAQSDADKRRRLRFEQLLAEARTNGGSTKAAPTS